MNDKTYDFLKRLSMVILPALGALYFGLAGIWGLPNAEQVVGSIVVIDTFLGVLLGVSKAQYDAGDRQYDGNMVISTTATGKRLYSLELNEDVDTLEDKSKIVFKTVESLSPEVKVSE